MKTLTIKDLSRNEDLDRKAMAKVHGGNRSYWPETGGRQPNGIKTYVPGGSGQYDDATWTLIPDAELRAPEDRPWVEPH
jgi:hypothetical protein